MTVHSRRQTAAPNAAALPDAAMTRVPDAPHPSAPRRRRLTRGFWIRQLHTWHWISSALSLAGLLLFVVTGFTLNHAGQVEGSARIRDGSGQLSPAFVAMLHRPHTSGKGPLPPALRAELARQSKLDVPKGPAEWSSDEIYLAMPRPGGDAWISVERGDGAIAWEVTNRGWIAYLNDLHKGRHTGAPWRLFIDGFVFAAFVFVGTGFALLWMHGRHRRATWPLTGLGLLIPILIAVFLVH